MTLRRLLAPELREAGGTVTLDEAAARHVHVLRLQSGASVVLFDGRGHEADATIEAIDRTSVRCVAEPWRTTRRGEARLGLMLALPKGAKLDGCVRMATELGVHDIALLETARTVPRWSSARAASRLDRLSRIAHEAATQCERSDVPTILPPVSLAEQLGKIGSGAWGVVFAARTKGALPPSPRPGSDAWCAIGPEGGFDQAELEAFREAGFVSASLGALVLRVETAVPAALAVVRDRMAGFGQVR